MPFSDYSTTPANNTTLAGLSLAENATALASLNNMLRQLMADGKTLDNTVGGLGTGMPTTGGTFTGNIIKSGKGGYYAANASGNTSPEIYTLVTGSPAPSSPSNGSIVIYHDA